MQRVGLTLQPEQFEKLSQLVSVNALDIAEINENSTLENESDHALFMLAELLKKTYHDTQALLDKF